MLLNIKLHNEFLRLTSSFITLTVEEEESIWCKLLEKIMNIRMGAEIKEDGNQ